VSAIKTPGELAAHRYPWPSSVHDEDPHAAARWAYEEGARADRELLAAALLDLAASWKRDAPLTSGGYVAGLREVVGMLGGTGR